MRCSRTLQQYGNAQRCLAPWKIGCCDSNWPLSISFHCFGHHRALDSSPFKYGRIADLSKLMHDMPISSLDAVALASGAALLRQVGTIPAGVVKPHQVSKFNAHLGPLKTWSGQRTRVNDFVAYPE